jgi:uncharacterized NAD(P)/FAD-binding protein YdhS
MQRITIIGGGASGTLLAVNLIKNSGENPIEINLVEKSKAIGRGVAYSTAEDVHLLNVPAAKMGAFPDDIEHFHRWLAANDYDYAPGDFVSRRLYGEYLREVFADAIAGKNCNVSLNLIDDEAIDVLTDKDSALVLLASGEVLPSHRVVLAFGNFLPPDLPAENRDYTNSEKYFRNAWSEKIPEKIAPDDEITIIGTGLSAVDAILTLHRRGHTGKITAISKHGWFPAVHAAAKPYQPLCEELEQQTTTLGVLKTVRRHCSRADNWRSVIDALRPSTQKTWLRLPIEEKRKFMRHLRRIWEVSRHRMPPQCAQILNKMQDEGKLKIRRGKIQNIEINGGKFRVHYLSSNEDKSFSTDAIINCIGAESDFGKIEFTLVKSLIERGDIVPDELALGLAATPDGKIISRENQISGVLRTLGTALRGVLWESTAMPEIRAQARTLSLNLLETRQNQNL